MIFIYFTISVLWNFFGTFCPLLVYATLLINTMQYLSLKANRVVKDLERMVNSDNVSEFDCYKWYDTVYKPLYDEMTNITNGSKRMFDSGIIVAISYCLIIIWILLSFVLSSNVLYVVLSGIFLLTTTISLGFLIFCLCQLTNDYFRIRLLINKTLISKYSRNNNEFYLQCARIKQSIIIHSIKGKIFEYQISWNRCLRRVIVFAISRIVVVFVADLGFAF